MRYTTTNPDGECYFSSEIPDILINDAHDPLTLTIRQGGSLIVEDEYVGREIRIRYLSATLRPYLTGSGKTLFNFEINDRRGLVLDGTFEVIRCDIGVDDCASAQQFESTHFLTSLCGVKRTNKNRSEFLSFCGKTQSGNVVVKFAGLYADQSGAESVIRKETSIQVPAYMAKTIDVSPSIYQEPGKTLCEYTISVEGRSQTFIVTPTPGFDKEFVFVNPFGVKESVGFIGGETSEGKRERQYGLMNGDYVPIYHHTVTEYTCFSGVLKKYEADWIQSLIESPEIIESRYGRRISILEDKLIRSSKLNELPQLEMKYRYAAISPLMTFEPGNRIFTQHYTEEYE